MSLPHNKKLTERSRSLRKNATKEENRLWYEFLRYHPMRFHRQHPIGNFIVDFYCHQAKLVIELDGSQHFSEAGQEYDAERSAHLAGLGIEVLRIPNCEISRNLSGVCEYIDQITQSRLTKEVPHV